MLLQEYRLLSLLTDSQRIGELLPHPMSGISWRVGHLPTSVELPSLNAVLFHRPGIFLCSFIPRTLTAKLSLLQQPSSCVIPMTQSHSGPSHFYWTYKGQFPTQNEMAYSHSWYLSKVVHKEARMTLELLSPKKGLEWQRCLNSPSLPARSSIINSEIYGQEKQAAVI